MEGLSAVFLRSPSLCGPNRKKDAPKISAFLTRQHLLLTLLSYYGRLVG